ncbi:uncharacterized protein LOC102359580 [Latimeria chalumnae]
MESGNQEYFKSPSSDKSFQISVLQPETDNIMQHFANCNQKTTVLPSEQQPCQTVYLESISVPLYHIIQPSCLQANYHLNSKNKSLNSNNPPVILGPVLHSENVDQSLSPVQNQPVPTVTLKTSGALQVLPGLGQCNAAIATTLGRSKSLGKYVCKHCGRDCLKPSALEKHIRSHTGERPFPCLTCGIAFKTQSNLYKHKRTQTHINNAKASSEAEAGSISEENERSGEVTMIVNQTAKNDNSAPKNRLMEVTQITTKTIVNRAEGETVAFSCLLDSEKAIQGTPQTMLTGYTLLPDHTIISRDNVSTKISPQITVIPEIQEDQDFQRRKQHRTPTSVSSLILNHKESNKEMPTTTAKKHSPLQRQYATISGKDWNYRSSRSSLKKCESTDSGYLSHSDSAEQQVWSSSSFQSQHGYSTESEPEGSSIFSPSAITSSKQEPEVHCKTITLPIEKKKLEEHISKLISDNSAVVDDKQLKNVRPRKTFLSKQGSIDLPMPYTYKDSFHFDIKTLDNSRKGKASPYLGNSSSTSENKSKQIFFYSVPTQFSTTFECAPVTRSSSLTFGECSKGLEDKRNRYKNLFLDKQTCNFATHSIDLSACHHRPLVRQIAVDDLPVNIVENFQIPEERNSNTDSSGDLTNIKAKSGGKKCNQRKLKKFSQDKWCIYGDETFKKLYQNMKSTKKVKHKAGINKGLTVLPKTYKRKKIKGNIIEPTKNATSVMDNYKSLSTVKPSSKEGIDTIQHYPFEKSVSRSQDLSLQSSSNTFAEHLHHSKYPMDTQETPTKNKVCENQQLHCITTIYSFHEKQTGTSHPPNFLEDQEEDKTFTNKSNQLDCCPQQATLQLGHSDIIAKNLSQEPVYLEQQSQLKKPSNVELESKDIKDNMRENISQELHQTAQVNCKLQNSSSSELLSGSEKLPSECKKLKVDEKGRQDINSLPPETIKEGILPSDSTSVTALCKHSDDSALISKSIEEEKSFLSLGRSPLKSGESIRNSEQMDYLEIRANIDQIHRLLEYNCKCSPASKSLSSSTYSTVMEPELPKHEKHAINIKCTFPSKLNLTSLNAEPNHQLSKSVGTKVECFSEKLGTQISAKEVAVSTAQLQVLCQILPPEETMFSPKYQLKLPEQMTHKRHPVSATLEENKQMACLKVPIIVTLCENISFMQKADDTVPGVVKNVPLHPESISLLSIPKQQPTIADLLKDIQLKQQAVDTCLAISQTSNDTGEFVHGSSDNNGATQLLNKEHTEFVTKMEKTLREMNIKEKLDIKCSDDKGPMTCTFSKSDTISSPAFKCHNQISCCLQSASRSLKTASLSTSSKSLSQDREQLREVYNEDYTSGSCKTGDITQQPSTTTCSDTFQIQRTVSSLPLSIYQPCLKGTTHIAQNDHIIEPQNDYLSHILCSSTSIHLPSLMMEPMLQQSQILTSDFSFFPEVPLSQNYNYVNFSSDNIFLSSVTSCQCQSQTTKILTEHITQLPLFQCCHSSGLCDYLMNSIQEQGNTTPNSHFEKKQTLQTVNRPSTSKISFSRMSSEPKLTWCLTRSLPLPSEQKERNNSNYTGLHELKDKLSTAESALGCDIVFLDPKTTCTLTTDSCFKAMTPSITWTTATDKVLYSAYFNCLFKLFNNILVDNLRGRSLNLFVIHSFGKGATIPGQSIPTPFSTLYSEEMTSAISSTVANFQLWNISTGASSSGVELNNSKPNLLCMDVSDVCDKPKPNEEKTRTTNLIIRVPLPVNSMKSETEVIQPDPGTVKHSLTASLHKTSQTASASEQSKDTSKWREKSWDKSTKSLMCPPATVTLGSAGSTNAEASHHGASSEMLILTAHPQNTQALITTNQSDHFFSESSFPLHPKDTTASFHGETSYSRTKSAVPLEIKANQPFSDEPKAELDGKILKILESLIMKAKTQAYSMQTNTASSLQTRSYSIPGTSCTSSSEVIDLPKSSNKGHCETQLERLENSSEVQPMLSFNTLHSPMEKSSSCIITDKSSEKPCERSGASSREQLMSSSPTESQEPTIAKRCLEVTRKQTRVDYSDTSSDDEGRLVIEI